MDPGLSVEHLRRVKQAAGRFLYCTTLFPAGQEDAPEGSDDPQEIQPEEEGSSGESEEEEF